MVRLSRVRKPRAIVIKKTMAERTVRDTFIPALGQYPLPPMEVLRGTRARHRKPSRLLSEGLASILWLASPRTCGRLTQRYPPGYCF